MLSKVFFDDTKHEELRITRLNLQKYYDKIFRELESARIIHDSILTRVDHPENIDFKVGFKPHHSIGGDFYGIIKLDDTRNVVYIGDVSGKGIPAAIMSCYLKNEIGFLIKNLKGLEDFSPAKVLYELNNSTMEIMKTSKSQATLVCGFINSKHKTFTCASAGHENPIFVNKTVQSISKRNGILMGFLMNYHYTNYTLNIKRGEHIILYTDGIIDQITSQNVRLGRDWLINTIKNIENKNIIPDVILQKLEVILKTNRQIDDMLLLSVCLR